MSLYDIINQEFESSSQVTEQYKSAKRKFVNALKKMFAVKLGAYEVIVRSCPHFEFSGFIRFQDRYVYFSTGDLRWRTSMLVRTAKHDKDWTGGHNNFVLYNDSFDEQFKLIVLNLLGNKSNG